jgi:hemoglobin
MSSGPARRPASARRTARGLRAHSPDPPIAQRGAAPHSVGVSEPQTPFALLGGADRVRALVESFYDLMSDREPALSRLHRCTPEGRVDRYSRDRFALFLIGWLGGPQDYIAQHGHPRLRMRHAGVPVGTAMRDAWLRCMTAAMDAQQLAGPVRAFLDGRFAEVADAMRNVAE